MSIHGGGYGGKTKIGVHLGLDYWSISISRKGEGEPERVADLHGDLFTPAVIYWGGTQFHIGTVALKYIAQSGALSDAEKKELQAKTFFKPIGLLEDNLPISLGEHRTIRPVDLAAEALFFLFQSALKTANSTSPDSVVCMSVPSDSTSAYRARLLESCGLAGMHHVAMIPEHIACHLGTRKQGLADEGFVSCIIESDGFRITPYVYDEPDYHQLASTSRSKSSSKSLVRGVCDLLAVTENPEPTPSNQQLNISLLAQSLLILKEEASPEFDEPTLYEDEFSAILEDLNEKAINPWKVETKRLFSVAVKSTLSFFRGAHYDRVAVLVAETDGRSKLFTAHFETDDMCTVQITYLLNGLCKAITQEVLHPRIVWADNFERAIKQTHPCTQTFTELSRVERLLFRAALLSDSLPFSVFKGEMDHALGQLIGNLSRSFNLAAYHGHLEVFLWLWLMIEKTAGDDARYFLWLEEEEQRSRYKKIVSTILWLEEGEQRSRYKEILSTSPLLCAASNGHLECVKAIIGCGCYVDALYRDHGTALHIAARNGFKETCEFLLLKGANANLRNLRMEAAWRGGLLQVMDVTALILAAQHGHAGCVEVLLAAGAKVDAIDRKEKTALICASQEGHLDCVKILLAAGADIELRDQCGTTPLIGAVEGGHLYCVEALLKAGAKLEIKDKDNYTALQRSCEHGNNEICHVLLESGAKLDVYHEGSDEAFDFSAEVAKPIVLAVEHGQFDCIRVLLASQSQISISNEDLIALCSFHKNYLYESSKWCWNDENYLEQKQVDLQQLLLCAVNDQNINCVNFFLAIGANTMQRDMCMPLPKNEYELLLILESQRQGGGVDYDSFFGSLTPLQYAATQGKWDVLRMLIDNYPVERTGAFGLMRKLNSTMGANEPMRKNEKPYDNSGPELFKHLLWVDYLSDFCPFVDGSGPGDHFLLIALTRDADRIVFAKELIDRSTYLSTDFLQTLLSLLTSIVDFAVRRTYREPKVFLHLLNHLCASGCEPSCFITDRIQHEPKTIKGSCEYEIIAVPGIVYAMYNLLPKSASILAEYGDLSAEFISEEMIRYWKKTAQENWENVYLEYLKACSSADDCEYLLWNSFYFPKELKQLYREYVFFDVAYYVENEI